MHNFCAYKLYVSVVIARLINFSFLAGKHDIPGSKKLAAAEQRVKLPDEKESDKPILCRQSSQDSQNSGKLN